MLPRFFFLGFLLLLCGSCSHGISDAPVLTVSIAPLRYFAENIAGDHFRISTLVPAGASPETYEPTPQQVVAISESKLYLCVGTLGFEQTSLRKLTDNSPTLLVVNTSDSIPLIKDQHNCKGHPTDGIDLHTWISTSSGRQIARNVCRALCTIDSAHVDYYQHRRDSLLAHIDSLDLRIHETLKHLLHRTFLIYHPALGYFARDYGLRQLSVEQDGREPSVRGMEQLVYQARSEGVQVVFVQEGHSGKGAQRIAETIGAKVVKIYPLSSDWDRQLLHIATSFSQ